MHSLQIDSQDEQTFLLIRLPRETIETSRQSSTTVAGNTKVGSIQVFDDGQAEFHDTRSSKTYTLMRNSTRKAKKKDSPVIANEESDLFKLSLQNCEADHLGKVKFSALLAVPKAGELDASIASD